jgi:hypothetical protein
MTWRRLRTRWTVLISNSNSFDDLGNTKSLLLLNAAVLVNGVITRTQSDIDLLLTSEEN